MLSELQNYRKVLLWFIHSIDEKNSCLGATPDGLIGENAIVEAKCPYSIFGQNIEDGILDGKCTMCKKMQMAMTFFDSYASQPSILGIINHSAFVFERFKTFLLVKNIIDILRIVNFSFILKVSGRVIFIIYSAKGNLNFSNLIFVFYVKSNSFHFMKQL